MAEKKSRNGKIDLLKFIFAVIVLIHHTRNVVGDEVSLFLGGSYAVEFFFIVSGYLMMQSISRMSPYVSGLGTETRQFVFKKFRMLCPELFLSHGIAMVVLSLANNIPFHKYLVTTSLEMFQLNMLGLKINAINHATWYLSAMLLCMAFWYPILRRYRDMALNVIVPLVSLLVLGYFCGNMESPRTPTEWIGWTYKGNLRALAELGLGICLYPITEKLKKVNFTRLGRWLLTLLEYCCWIQLIWYMYFNLASRRDYFYFLFYLVGIMIAFSGQGIDTKFFAGRFGFLGKASLALYLNHSYWSRNVIHFLPEGSSDKQLLAAYYVCSIGSTLVVMVVSAIVRKYGKKVLSAIARCLYKQPQSA